MPQDERRRVGRSRSSTAAPRTGRSSASPRSPATTPASRSSTWAPRRCAPPRWRPASRDGAVRRTTRPRPPPRAPIRPSDLNATPDFRRHLAARPHPRALDAVQRKEADSDRKHRVRRGSFVGAPVRRVEDPDLLTRARPPTSTTCTSTACSRSRSCARTVAHAGLESIDTSDARAMPGVVGVYTADDLDVPEYFHVHEAQPRRSRGPSLAQDRVRFVGDIVAVVVAETRAQAVDAAEAVDRRLRPAPRGDRPRRRARARRAAAVRGARHQRRAAATAATPGDPLDDAEVIVRGRFENQRVAVVPMEGAACAVVPGDDGLGHDVIDAPRVPDAAHDARCSPPASSASTWTSSA